jgi:hypothetical protein
MSKSEQSVLVVVCFLAGVTGAAVGSRILGGSVVRADAVPEVLKAKRVELVNDAGEVKVMLGAVYPHDGSTVNAASYGLVMFAPKESGQSTKFNHLGLYVDREMHVHFRRFALKAGTWENSHQGSDDLLPPVR